MTNARKGRSRPVPASRRPRPAPARPRWSRTHLVLAALLVLALAALAVVGNRWYDHRAMDRGWQEALAAGKQAAVNFVSLSVSTVDRDLQRIIEGSTGQFREEYERNKATFRTRIVESRAEATGTVLRAGVLSGDRDSAVVLIAIDATIRNTGNPDGRLSHYRLQLDMARDAESGRWLVSLLQFVG